ncbi:MAG: TolC family protein [Paludibacteraceae bacterium]|nr:TolC family protein [Paludibacteraceae bacterium]
MKLYFLFLTLLWGSVSLCAQTLEQCRSMAREHYPAIKQYDLINKAEEYNVSNAARAWIPQIVLSGQATYQSATPTYPEKLNAMLAASGLEMSGMRQDQYKIALDINQNIWDGGVSKAHKTVAQAEAAEQRSKTDVTLYDLQNRVDNIYFGILLLEQKKAQTEAMIALLESNLSRMRSQYKNGVARQTDVDVIEAELLGARQGLTQIEASLNSYRNMLELFIGQPLTDDKLPLPAMPAITDRTVRRPELALFDAQTSLLDAQKKTINTAVTPRFSLFAQGYYGYPGMDMFKSMTSSDWTLNGLVGVRMQWNISGFYTHKNNLEKIANAQENIAVQRDIFLFNTELKTTQEDAEIARLKKVIADDARIVELRKNVRLAAESQLENNVIDATDLLRKITDETTAKLNQSTHEIELLQAVYRLKNTLNQ